MKKKIYTLEELSCILDLFVTNKDHKMREAIAELGYGLDELINDPYPSVRKVVKLSTVRECGVSLSEMTDILDKLFVHHDEGIRNETCRFMYRINNFGEMNYTIEDLDNMIVSDEAYIRIEVAGCGYGLNRLIFDPDPWVRAEVAKHGYMTSVLAHDPDWQVRVAVAGTGYAVHSLTHDLSNEVKAAAYAYLESQK